MVSSRTITSSRPVFHYKSKGYAVLYYGACRKEGFKTSDIKKCLSGLFPKQDTNADFVTTAKRLQQAGLLAGVDKDTWRVTEAGIKAILVASAYYREYRWRTVGQLFLEKAHEQIRTINHSMMPLMEKLDAEDAILNQIEDAITMRNNRKQKKKVS